MELSQYFVALKFAKELLRTPIKNITGISFFVMCQEQHVSFMFGELYPTIPPLVMKKGITAIGVDCFENGQFNIWFGYRGELFKIEGNVESGIDYILKYYNLIRGKNNLIGMYYPGEAKYQSFDVYSLDTIIKNKDRTLLELQYPTFEQVPSC